MANETLNVYAGELRAKYQKKINDTFIWASLALDALRQAATNHDFLDKEDFAVPSTRKGKTIRRTKRDLVRIFKEAVANDFNYTVFTYLVAQTEAYLSDMICTVLKTDHRRLKTRIQGIDHVKKIDADEGLDAANLTELIEGLIEKEMVSLFYASPEKQFEYISKVLGAEIDTDVINKWKEYKACRDLIVHNSGIINSVYISKVGAAARGVAGEQIKVDAKYLGRAIADMKAMIGRISTRIQKKNKA